MPKYLTDGKLKISDFLIFEIKRAKSDKIFNFLEGRFSVISESMDIICGVFLCEASKKYNFAFFSQNIAKVITY